MNAQNAMLTKDNAKAERIAKKIERDAEKLAKDNAKAAKLAEKIERDAEKLAKKIERDAEKLAKKIERDAEKLAKSIAKAARDAKKIERAAYAAGAERWYTDNATTVRITGMELRKISKDFGELRVYFNTVDWNTETDGLIYNNSKFLINLQGFLRVVCDLPDAVGYSEQGMQGRDYVSFDVCKEEFLAGWETKKPTFEAIPGLSGYFKIV